MYDLYTNNTTATCPHLLPSSHFDNGTKFADVKRDAVFTRLKIETMLRMITEVDVGQDA